MEDANASGETSDAAESGRRLAPRAPASKRTGLLRFLRDVVVIVVLALFASFLIKTFLVRSFFIPSESMLDTLRKDDRILVNELVPSPIGLERGDVVVFTDPGGWLYASPEAAKPPLLAALDAVLGFVGLSASDSEDHLVKRVIGLPGDRVVCCDAEGRLVINGEPISEPYIRLLPGESRASLVDFDVTVPADSLWVMGDNRNNSRDSRFNQSTPLGGFVPVENVVGRAFVVSWPVSNWAWLDNFPDTFAEVPAAAE